MRPHIARAKRFLSAQEGATAIEYAVIASGIAGAIVVSLTTIGGKVAEMWTTISGMF